MSSSCLVPGEGEEEENTPLSPGMDPHGDPGSRRRWLRGGSGVPGGHSPPCKGTVLLLADGSQRVRLDKEHFIEVMNSLSLLNAELIKNVKELFLHPPCYQRGFAASL